MKPRDQLREVQPVNDGRQTRELCGKARGQLRCMLPKGHDGRHNTITPSESLDWD